MPNSCNLGVEMFNKHTDTLADNNDELVFAKEETDSKKVVPEKQTVHNGCWNIMIVDDEKEIHNVTKLALNQFTFESRGINFISAYSGKEAKQLFQAHKDIALILLDVVMETDNAGLQVAKYIREELANQQTRIVLRTGQPGLAPEEKVIVEYDINDYKEKTELTRQKLFTTVVSSLRSYRQITGGCFKIV